MSKMKQCKLGAAAAALMLLATSCAFFSFSFSAGADNPNPGVTRVVYPLKKSGNTAYMLNATNARSGYLTSADHTSFASGVTDPLTQNGWSPASGSGAFSGTYLTFNGGIDFTNASGNILFGDGTASNVLKVQDFNGNLMAQFNDGGTTGSLVLTSNLFADRVILRNASSSTLPSGTVSYLQYDGSNGIFNVPSGKGVSLSVGAVPQFKVTNPNILASLVGGFDTTLIGINAKNFVFSDGTNVLSTIYDNGTTGIVEATGLLRSNQWNNLANGASIVITNGGAVTMQAPNTFGYTYSDTGSNTLATLSDDGTTGTWTVNGVATGSTQGRVKSTVGQMSIQAAAGQTVAILDTSGATQILVGSYGDGTNGVTLGSGGSQFKWIKTATAVIDFGALTTACEVSSNITVANAADGDSCSVGVAVASITAGSSFNCYVNGAGTVVVQHCQVGVGGNPASGTFRVTVTHF